MSTRAEEMLAAQMLRSATCRMLCALDHYWAAYDLDGDRMELWWNAFERERAKVEAFLR